MIRKFRVGSLCGEGGGGGVLTHDKYVCMRAGAALALED